MAAYRGGIAAVVAGLAAVTTPAPANADATVTYEVLSSYVSTATIAFSDVEGQHVLNDVTLPWRLSARVADAHTAAAALGVDWQSQAGRYKWVVVRIYTSGSLLCERTLDAGSGSCDGRGPYADMLPRW